MEFSEILSLLASQHDDFVQAEKLTEQILYAPAEDFPNLIDQRGTFLEHAVLTENQLKQAGSGEERLRGVLDGSAEPGALSPELREIYEASLRVKAALCRIHRLEPQVVTRMENERAEALSHLEELNASGNSTAAAYSHALRTAVPSASFMGTRSV